MVYMSLLWILLVRLLAHLLVDHLGALRLHNQCTNLCLPAVGVWRATDYFRGHHAPKLSSFVSRMALVTTLVAPQLDGGCGPCGAFSRASVGTGLMPVTACACRVTRITQRRRAPHSTLSPCKRVPVCAPVSASSHLWLPSTPPLLTQFASCREATGRGG